MRGINLSPKTPLSQIALYKVPCQRKHQEKVMKGERVGEKKKKKRNSTSITSKSWKQRASDLKPGVNLYSLAMHLIGLAVCFIRCQS